MKYEIILKWQWCAWVFICLLNGWLAGYMGGVDIELTVII